MSNAGAFGLLATQRDRAGWRWASVCSTADGVSWFIAKDVATSSSSQWARASTTSGLRPVCPPRLALSARCMRCRSDADGRGTSSDPEEKYP